MKYKPKIIQSFSSFHYFTSLIIDGSATSPSRGLQDGWTYACIKTTNNQGKTFAQGNSMDNLSLETPETGGKNERAKNEEKMGRKWGERG